MHSIKEPGRGGFFTVSPSTPSPARVQISAASPLPARASPGQLLPSRPLLLSRRSSSVFLSSLARMPFATRVWPLAPVCPEDQGAPSVGEEVALSLQSARLATTRDRDGVGTDYELSFLKVRTTLQGNSGQDREQRIYSRKDRRAEGGLHSTLGASTATSVLAFDWVDSSCSAKVTLPLSF